MTTTTATSVVYRGIARADYRPVNRDDYDLFGTVQRSDGKYIKTRLNLMNSSPTPAISLAMQYYQDFKRDVIGNIADPGQGWELSQQYILDWVKDMRVTHRLQGKPIFRRGLKGEEWLNPTQEELDKPIGYVETEGKETYY